MSKFLFGKNQPVSYQGHTVLVGHYLYRFRCTNEANWECILLDRELSPAHSRAINEAFLILDDRRRAANNNNRYAA